MSEYDLKFYKHESGNCQKCGKFFDELYTAVVHTDTKSSKYVLCGNCSSQLQKSFEQKYNSVSEEPDNTANALTCALCGKDIPSNEKYYEKEDDGITITLCKSCAMEAQRLEDEYIDEDDTDPSIPGTMQDIQDIITTEDKIEDSSRGYIWIYIMKICAFLSVLSSCIICYIIGDKIFNSGVIFFFVGLILGLISCSGIMAFSNLCEDIKEIRSNQDK